MGVERQFSLSFAGFKIHMMNQTIAEIAEFDLILSTQMVEGLCFSPLRHRDPLCYGKKTSLKIRQTADSKLLNFDGADIAAWAARAGKQTLILRRAIEWIARIDQRASGLGQHGGREATVRAEGSQ